MQYVFAIRRRAGAEVTATDALPIAGSIHTHNRFAQSTYTECLCFVCLWVYDAVSLREDLIY